MSSAPVSNYDQPAVVASYRQRLGLYECERYLFEKYIRPGQKVLDLGVGAGRTAAWLAPRAAAYVGIDYAPHMVQVCRQTYPEYRFEVGDASDLSRFPDRSFDVVVAALSGIDYLPTEPARESCFRHCSRVLADGGMMIFSAHNVRRILCRPLYAGASWTRKLWRTARAPFASLQLVWRIGLSSAFVRGHGFIWDPADGGTSVHLATSEHIRAETAAVGLSVLEMVPHDYPLRTGALTTPWFYYAARKTARSS